MGEGKTLTKKQMASNLLETSNTRTNFGASECCGADVIICKWSSPRPDYEYCDECYKKQNDT